MSSVSEVTELRNLDQNSFLKIYFLFNSKLNGQKLDLRCSLAGFTSTDPGKGTTKMWRMVR